MLKRRSQTNQLIVNGEVVGAVKEDNHISPIKKVNLTNSRICFLFLIFQGLLLNSYLF